MAKIDWDQYPDAEVTPKKSAKIDWDSFPDAPKSEKELNLDHVKTHENDGFIDKIKDPARWQAILNNTGPYAKEAVAGTAPMVIPGTVIPKLTKAAVALANGKGIGYALGRTALATGQGAAMSAVNSEENGLNKLKDASSGAKLSGGIQLAAEAIPVVGKFIGAGARKLGSAISGVDENILKNYASRTDDVNDLIKQSGGDMTVAADQVRSELSSGIQRTKGAINKNISDALSKSKNVTRIDETPILDALNTARSKLNPNFDSSAINEIDEMTSIIMAEAKTGRADGGLTSEGLYKAKQFLNEASKSSYKKDGAIFTRSNASARAAKDAASQAREAIKKYVPEISDADAQLSRLHQIEGRLNKNLLAEGKPDGALFAAGSGANQRNAATLKELERISGVPVSQRAMDLATAKTFAKPGLTPSDYTGKVVGRMMLGAGIGYGVNGNEGAAIGGAMASPFAMKAGINVANAFKQISSRVPSFANFARTNPVAAQAIVQLLSGQIKKANGPNALPPEAVDFIQQNPVLMENIQDQQPKKPEQNREPALKGESLWMQKGADKLGIASEKVTSKEGKRLLIEASDLPPNSKRLELIKQKLKGMEK